MSRKWAQLDGRWDTEGETVTFKGERITQEEEFFFSVGVALSNETFSGGRIEGDVTFSGVKDRNSCDLVFSYDTSNKMFACAGIGGMQSLYTIRHWDTRQWQVHAVGGEKVNLKANQEYHIAVDVQGARVDLSVDEVRVLTANLPFPIPPSQVGIHCIDETDVTIKNFKVTKRQPKAFVVMQFTSPYNEIHQEVIKKVCGEFDVEAVRADDTFGPGLIIADVVRQINEATFIIAEITPANPNVYYELGYAHALRKHVVLIADKTITKLPFDVSPYRTLFYENTIAGRSHFEEGLRKHLAAILGKSLV